jgi:hypothetical protein
METRKVTEEREDSAGSHEEKIEKRMKMKLRVVDNS